MMTVDDNEREQSRMIDQLADLDAGGLARHAQHLADDVKFDVRSGDETHLAVYADEFVAFGRVLEDKFFR